MLLKIGRPTSLYSLWVQQRLSLRYSRAKQTCLQSRGQVNEDIGHLIGTFQGPQGKCTLAQLCLSSSSS